MHQNRAQRQRETETEREKKVTVQRFTPPTVSQVAEYCKERGNGVDPEEFVDFYESKGWMIGKNKMKSWQATVRRWEKTSTKKTSHDPFAGAI